MAIYRFVREGRSYKVTGPNGSTQTEAAAVLDAQLASGSLTGQRAGAVLNLESQVQNGLNLLDLRLPAESSPAVSGLPDDTPTNAVSVTDIAKQKPADITVGSLNESQVRGLLSQQAKAVDQTADQVSNDKGVGFYGLKLQQLEQAGYLKPGTTQQSQQQGLTLTDTVQNPSVWTGKNNMTSLSAFQSSTTEQQKAQQNIYSLSYNTLQAQGLVNNRQAPQDLGAVLNVSSQFGTSAAASWLKGQTTGAIANQITSTAQLGRYATNLGTLASTSATGSFSTTLLTAGQALGASLPGAGAVATSLGVFANIYKSNSGIGAALRTNLGPYQKSITTAFSELGTKLSALPGEVASSINQGLSTVSTSLGLSQPVDIYEALVAVPSTGPQDIYAGLELLGGESNAANFFTSIGQGANNLLGDIGSGISGLFGDTTFVDALGNETTISLLSSLRLDAAAALDSAGQLFGIGNLGNSLFGSFSSISGVSTALQTFGPVLSVFTSFFGGGSGDGSGLNFSLVSQARAVPSYFNTVNRDTVDGATARIIGSDKVSGLSFGSSLTNVFRPVPVDTTGYTALRATLGRAQASAAQQQSAQLDRTAADNSL